MARIIIDAGHGGSERAGNSSAYGARGASGVVEKDVTLDIAKQVIARLGGAAALTRTGDRNLTLGARAAKAQQADVFVSIHANYGAPEQSGPEVYVHPEAGRGSRALAGQIAVALDRLSGRYGGSADERRGAMAVLNPGAIGARTAACLVEVDYLSNPRGERRLGDPGERAAIGAAIAGAIQQHLATGLSWDLAEAIRTIDPEIDRTSLSSSQKHRLHDLLGILRSNPNANDHYLNGLDSELQRIGPRLDQPQFDIMVRNRVTQDLLQQPHWDTPPHIAESLRLLDERIWHGIQYLARRAATDGAAMSAGLQQLMAWIHDRQSDRNSIYHAYGDMQNRYQGGYGQQLDLNQNRGALESGSLTLEPGIPGHVQVLLTNAHNGGNLCLEGTLTWSAGAGQPRTITARLTELASQGFIGADHPVRQPSDYQVAIPLIGADNQPLRWPVPVNAGPVRIDLAMQSNDPHTRVRIDWRVVVAPPQIVQPAPTPLGGVYGQQSAQRPLVLRGREHGRVPISVSRVDSPDTRTITFTGTADLRAGRGLRLGAHLEDANLPSSIPHVQYVDLDSINRTRFTFSWPCSNLLPGHYQVVLRVDGADDRTEVEINHGHTIGGGYGYGYGPAEALQRPSPDPWIVPDPASYRGSFVNMIGTWAGWFVDHALWRSGVPNTALSTFPHAAIAELEITYANGTSGFGTGFYIGHEKLLTCGHNFLTNPGRVRATSVIVRLAKPSRMSVIGHTVAIPNATTLVHPTFNASLDRDFDLAVLHTPGVSPPLGQYFPLPNMSPAADQNIVVCAYSKFVNHADPMDGQGQTIDGGRIVNATPEQYHFTIQGLPGSSGGPVFWPDNNGMVVAVMTGPRFLGPHNTPPISDHENRGVRLTPAKNTWIDSM
jgi:N-acetylmuramoyl-L-alanine amidase